MTERPTEFPTGSGIRAEASDDELFRLLTDGDVSGEARARAREILVARYAHLVRWAARRYGGRGEGVEELAQVGYVGLMEAIGRFDPDRGVDFASYARPTVLGEIKRHFRDRRRWVRLPRRLQELKATLREASEQLAQSSGRPPTPSELAIHLGLAEDVVNEAFAVDDTFAPVSLDTPADSEEDSGPRIELMGGDDERLALLVELESLWPLLDDLPERERRMVLMRFYGNQTQLQIAQRLGISQMHVSRMLDRTLTELRERLAPAS